MKNLITTPTAAPTLAGLALFNVTAVNVITKSVKPVYGIEDAVIDGENIDVDYLLNDYWFRTVVTMPAITEFVLAQGLNEYCFDSSANGEHIQDSGLFEVDTFILENFKAVIRAYFEFNKVGQQNVN